jgi:hypothetical protein
MSKMTEDELITAYKRYLADFNRHDISAIEKHLAPNCEFWTDHGTRLLNKGRETMLPNYVNHWKILQTDIELREIKPIKSGVWTRLRNWDESKDFDFEYWYDENDQQCRHVFMGAHPFDKAEEKK